MVKNNAEYLRTLRQEAVANGKCYQCRCRLAKPGTRYCIVCTDKTKATKAAVKGHLCMRCFAQLAGDRVGKTRCQECEDKAFAHESRRRADSLARGVCGKCHRLPRHGDTTMCVSCLDENKNNVLAVARANGRGVKWRPCAICTAAGVESINHDRRTHDRYMEAAKAWR